MSLTPATADNIYFIFLFGLSSHRLTNIRTHCVTFGTRIVYGSVILSVHKVGWEEVISLEDLGARSGRAVVDGKRPALVRLQRKTDSA